MTTFLFQSRDSAVSSMYVRRGLSLVNSLAKVHAAAFGSSSSNGGGGAGAGVVMVLVVVLVYYY